MMAVLKALERRMQILLLLNVRRSVTVGNLAFEFQVSKNTIYRDIETLSISHPIYTTQGNSGGVHVIDGCMLNLNALGVRLQRYLKRG